MDVYADGYRILRSTTAGGPYSKLNSSLLTSSAYTDTGVANGVTYYYVVTAVDDCANESANSNEESAAYSVFGAVADTYVKEEKGGDDNFGADAELTVKADSGKVKRALVSFDVSSIPSGSTINSATLTLCLSANPGSTRTHELRRITSSWLETVVVWNDQPTASGTVTDTITVPTTAQCLTFTVTADVQAWVDGAANNGWRISDQDETTDSGDVNYRSRENGTTNERPKLEVVYAPP
ncbi:MAG: DNRLRE domain-containing protein [Chloroflexi bacterium]|nr:DNRLRE domain-containing protein [Chloroflexota bacterium]